MSVSDKDLNYLKELKWRSDKINNDFDKQVFLIVCSYFQEFKDGQRKNKIVSKELISDSLANKGYLKVSDKKITASANALLKAGFPIVSNKDKKGYFIAEKVCEIDTLQKKNYEKTMNFQAIDNGYSQMRTLLSGQGRIFL